MGRDRGAGVFVQVSGYLEVSAVLLLMLRTYRACVSPFLPPSCRFYPTCSQYAEDAVRHHGWLRGTMLAARRILRCHPLGPHGYDPLP